MNALRVLGSVVVVTALASAARATDHHVGPSDSIQAAIDAALDGDRILVAAGTYVEQIDFRGKQLHVIGLSGAEATTLDAGGTAPVVHFAGAETVSTLLQGFTITGGFSNSNTAGVVVSSGAQPRIEDCHIVGNIGRWGGGLSGDPILRRCVIANNRASLTHGGGIYGAPQMTHCVVAGNIATSASGGGMYVPGRPTTIEDCLFVGNSTVLAGSKGGGLYVDSRAHADVRRTVFVDNLTTGEKFNGVGGAVVAENANVLLESCTVLRNTATGSSVHGGGLFGPMRVVNTIVRLNSEPQISGATSVSYSNVEGGANGTGNFDAVPRFAELPLLDLHLRVGSPCIDAGDPALLDPDGSRSDVGAFPYASLYVRSNALSVYWSVPSWPEISATVGGRTTMVILAGVKNANSLALTLGSLSGSSPGTTLFGAPVPLNPDAYFHYTLKNPNSPLLEGSFDTLSSNGRGEVTFHLAPDLRAPLAGLEFRHATLVGTASPLEVKLVTQALPITVVD